MHDPPNLSRFHAKLGITVADACPTASAIETIGLAKFEKDLL